MRFFWGQDLTAAERVSFRIAELVDVVHQSDDTWFGDGTDFSLQMRARWEPVPY
jgi:hypothetical protein